MHPARIVRHPQLIEEIYCLDFRLRKNLIQVGFEYKAQLASVSAVQILKLLTNSQTMVTQGRIDAVYRLHC